MPFTISMLGAFISSLYIHRDAETAQKVIADFSSLAAASRFRAQPGLASSGLPRAAF
jgi:hypothetical protein